MTGSQTGADANFLIGGGQPNNTTELKPELDYHQNKLNNARTTREYNDNALQPITVTVSCIVRDNQVMNDQCQIE